MFAETLCFQYLWKVEAQLENYTKSELIALVAQHQNQASHLTKENTLLAEKNTLLVERTSRLIKRTRNTQEISSKLEKKAIRLEEKVSSLISQLEYLQRFTFGQKRERFVTVDGSIIQPLPFEIDPEVDAQAKIETTEKISYERRKGKTIRPVRQPLPEHLPVVEVVIEPEIDLEGMICIGQEVTDELEYTPAQYYIKRYIRPKYARKGSDGVAIAPLPSRIIPKGIAGPNLLASILIDKYADHLPLYRQEQRFKRQNIPIARSTLTGWVEQALNAIDILYQRLLIDTKSKGYLQVDETTIPVLDKSKKGKCHRGYYWVFHNPIDKTVLFDYQPGRDGKAPMSILKDFKGYLQSDAYSVYDKIGEQDGVTHLNCWAHARREFDRALTNDQNRAQTALVFIQSLYAVEAEAREKGLSPEERKELRLNKSLPIINAFNKWMAEELKTSQIIPKSKIWKAINYSLIRWEKLSAYLLDGTLEIDTNQVENAIRVIALGRKNYLFAGSHEAARRAAKIYSLLAICKKNEVNPHQWLTYVLKNILDTKTTEIHTLYPQHFNQLNHSKGKHSL